MASKIPWTDEGLDLVGGCTKTSDGCRECYAMKLVGNRFANNRIFKGRYHGLVKDGNWTGEIKLFEDRLDKPRRWRDPRRIFVCPYSDLFHESVPFDFIEKVMAVIEQCPQHDFQILTKRPHITAEYFNGLGKRFELSCLRNLWLGVTAENQKTADERIPILLQIPAAVRFVSVEPMLGPVDMKPYVSLRQRCVGRKGCGFEGPSYAFVNPKKTGGYKCPKCGKNHTYLCTDNVDWVICGPENGPKRRPFDVQWARGLAKQCDAAGVPVFIKPSNWLEWPDDLKDRQEYPKGE